MTPTTVVGGQHATDRAMVIGSVGMFVQAPTAGVVPVVHAIAGGQPVSPGVVFVGRHDERERLLAALAPGDAAGPVAVSAVAGMGGVGKTALARFCAAVTAFEHARDILQEVGDRRYEGSAWSNLALALANLHRVDEVPHCLREAAAAYGDSGDNDKAQAIQQILED